MREEDEGTDLGLDGVGFWFSRSDEVWESMDGFIDPPLIYNREANATSHLLLFSSFAPL